MEHINFDSSVYTQKREFFDSGHTKSYKFRIEQLKNLKIAIKKHEKEIIEALHIDLHKPTFEAFTAEVGVLYEEINYVIKNLRKWMRPKRVGTPIILEASRSKVISEPLGVVLVLGPWNYPFQLIISPVIGAIAAGNCVLIKPSHETQKTASVIEKIIHETFPVEYVSVLQGPGSSVGTALMKQFSWNHIFFTGSPQVGRIVAEIASANLTPVTLELGGKSPAIVDKNVDIDKAAKRIVFGKFYNAGQTCVSPDYALVHTSVKDKFMERLEFHIRSFYGEDPLNSDHLSHIVNSKRFNVLKSYLDQGKIFVGGSVDEKKFAIEPTVLHEIEANAPVMQEEIFGPILPILEWESKKDIIETIRLNRYPLSCYIFTKSREFEKFVIDNIEFGGGSVNNTVVQQINPNLPFGGVGTSGMGRYHGKYSFETFSHKKAVMKTSTRIDLPMRYAPYKNKDLKIVKWFFR